MARTTQNSKLEVPELHLRVTLPPVIHLENVRKRYPGAETDALRGIDLVIEAHDFVSLVGRSGSGKTTLLNVIGGLDRAFEGEVRVADHESQVTKLRMDTSFEALLHESDPIRLEYDAFRDQFGRDELIVVAVGSENVFAIDFLKRLQAIHGDLEAEVPYVERVHSLVNARHTRAEEDVLFVESISQHL